MQANQVVTEVTGWLKRGLAIAGVAILAIVVLKMFGIQITGLRIAGSITELAVVAAACIYAGR